jgi:hypothetical protein
MTARASIRLLQLVLGILLCAFSLELVIAQLRGPHHGTAFVHLLILGIAEAAAAIVLLLNSRLGGMALLVIFAVAGLFHLLHGEISHLGTLAIYAASVLAVMSNRNVG